MPRHDLRSPAVQSSEQRTTYMSALRWDHDITSLAMKVQDLIYRAQVCLLTCAVLGDGR